VFPCCILAVSLLLAISKDQERFFTKAEKFQIRKAKYSKTKPLIESSCMYIIFMPLPLTTTSGYKIVFRIASFPELTPFRENRKQGPSSPWAFSKE